MHASAPRTSRDIMGELRHYILGLPRTRIDLWCAVYVKVKLLQYWYRPFPAGDIGASCYRLKLKGMTGEIGPEWQCGNLPQLRWGMWSDRLVNQAEWSYRSAEHLLAVVVPLPYTERNIAGLPC